ncbi:hypothetical protein [Magnetospirillum sulfuroxidans]|uniref:J domain-containing protein n=1 Tax=Magnetospirillum sulfuroxidans TaxID=611300 RepID=A0ABS5IFL2_9PROT|nr:hypothetical protein [Magnetospirillum sulfuroxidans]MBR9973202.1 hypothetical protein [Magnetospirillum sulfuroxidans]
MIMPLLIVLGLVVVAWLLFGWLKRVHPRHAAKVMTAFGLAALVVAGVWLVLTGKLAGLAAIGAGLAPWLGRAVKLHSVWKSARDFLGQRQNAPPPPPPPPPTPRPSNGMSVEEAREVLGVDANADTAAIKSAHRRLMEANHPDRGGSNWIASRLNQARDRLLS